MTATPLGKRLEWILKNRGFPDAKALSVKAGLAPGHVGQMIRGEVKGNPHPKTLEKLAEVSGVDHGWLATGKGEPVRDSAPVPVHTKHREALTAMVPEDATAIELAISRAFGAGAGDRYVISDGAAAMEAARSLPMFIHEGSEHDWARDFVEAARFLRLKGQPVTAQAVKDRALVTRYGLNSDQIGTLSAEANADADAESAKWNKPPSKKSK